MVYIVLNGMVYTLSPIILSSAHARNHSVLLFVQLAPTYGLPQLTPEQMDERYKEVYGAMEKIEGYLKGSKFLVGDEITLADLFIANEV